MVGGWGWQRWQSWIVIVVVVEALDLSTSHPNQTKPHQTRPNPHHISSHHITSHHIASRHITSPDIPGCMQRLHRPAQPRACNTSLPLAGLDPRFLRSADTRPGCIERVHHPARPRACNTSMMLAYPTQPRPCGKDTPSCVERQQPHPRQQQRDGRPTPQRSGSSTGRGGL